MRLELTNRTELALRAILLLEAFEGDRPTKGRDLAAALGTSATYLPLVMRPLVQAGWVSSGSGPQGGYALTESLRTITLLMLIEAVEGPTRDDICVLRGTPCAVGDECAMHGAWSKARSALLSELNQSLLSDLATPQAGSISQD
jgi:Rrf2 family protein